jgi:hypothetical protein
VHDDVSRNRRRECGARDQRTVTIGANVDVYPIVREPGVGVQCAAAMRGTDEPQPQRVGRIGFVSELPYAIAGDVR